MGSLVLEVGWWVVVGGGRGRVREVGGGGSARLTQTHRERWTWHEDESKHQPSKCQACDGSVVGGGALY